MYKILGIGVLFVLLYYAAIFVIADTAIDVVKKESKNCGGVAKCSGEAIGGFINNFKEGMNKADK